MPVIQITVIGNDLNKLHKIFDPAILPEELGGDLPNGDIIATVLTINGFFLGLKWYCNSEILYTRLCIDIKSI